ncbi:winged helix-turn helix protein [Streptomyces sp. 2333.5]|nr:winged helix-turn helix protein [Streptomyces sp. 2333.5]SEE70912.1 Winged helix-turn helix [Streptomyces sp. 2112.2]
MAERVRVREVDDDEGRRLLRIICRGMGSVVTWRRAQMVLLSAQGMSVAKIAEVTFTSADRIRNVIHNFNTDGFDSLYQKYKGGRPKTFTLPEREIKKIACAASIACRVSSSLRRPQRMERGLRAEDEGDRRRLPSPADPDRLTFNGTIVKTGTDSYRLASTRSRA